MSQFRPMLAAPTTELELQQLPYPMLGSPKIDGVRMLVGERNGAPVCLSRKLEVIPNLYVQTLFARPEFVGLDGELVVGPANAKNVWNVTQSGVSKAEGQPLVKFYVFDKSDMNEPYVKRAYAAMQIVQAYQQSTLMDTIQWVPQVQVPDYHGLRIFEEYNLNQGFEGLILRKPNSPYKHGRSTVKQGWMVKVKRFADDEAEVIGTVEQQTNLNAAETNELGYTKRSHSKAGKEAAGVLGTLVVKGTTGQFAGVEFEIGTGFTAEQRANLWAGREYLPGKLVTYKHFPIGALDRPRHPVFKGFRHTIDT